MRARIKSDPPSGRSHRSSRYCRAISLPTSAACPAWTGRRSHGGTHPVERQVAAEALGVERTGLPVSPQRTGDHQHQLEQLQGHALTLTYRPGASRADDDTGLLWVAVTIPAEEAGGTVLDRLPSNQARSAAGLSAASDRPWLNSWARLDRPCRNSTPPCRAASPGGTQAEPDRRGADSASEAFSMSF